MSASGYHERFIKTIITLSVSKVYTDAVKEWYCFLYKPEGIVKTCDGCGKHHITMNCHVRNKINGNVLVIGRDCVKHIDAQQYTEITSIARYLNRVDKSVLPSALIAERLRKYMKIPTVCSGCKKTFNEIDNCRLCETCGLPWRDNLKQKCYKQPTKSRSNLGHSFKFL